MRTELAIFASALVGAGISAAAMAMPVLNPGNGNFYQYFTTAEANLTSWHEARAFALAQSHMGMSGYLATVTSADENSFISNNVTAATAFLGGFDETVEGEWRWADGPEAGQLFAIGALAQAGFYENWNAGEPNNAGNEDFLHTNFGSLGGWNDIPSSSGLTDGFIVEYSAAAPTVSEPAVMATAAVALGGLAVYRRKRG